MSIKPYYLSLFICGNLFVMTTLFASNNISTNSDKYKTIATRNVFRPLWATEFNNSDDKSRKEELEALKKSEKERIESQKLAEEQAKIDNKKKEIEQNYSLTGIIFDKGKKQAVIQDRKGLSSFMYENDFLDEAKIISINETKSEVILDYKGKFTVVFRME
ncbi:MAG: hypothetical protein A2252_06395 [Elusimicrobia bacterium RIFOXYA2_FULL_39_19]|nr:MAG: hypothetical protein A2252_06395 [Elusimicrobia bacterium RIFOXYA2_FULL_39_19]